MARFMSAGMLILLLAGCAQAPPVTCPDPAAIAPPSIGAAYITGLGARLAGPDRENSIAEAIAEIHQRDPSLDATMVTDLLIAADCPVAAAKPDHGIAAERARIAGYRAQVDQLLGK